MIRFLGWVTLLCGLVALGWWARGADLTLPRVPSRFEADPAPKATAPTQAPPKARPAPAKAAARAEYRDPPERPTVGAGFATQGIGYYDVRDYGVKTGN